MKILLTGASGFLGKEIYNELSRHHEIITLGRSNSNHVIAELSSGLIDLPTVDMVIDAAGKAHSLPKTKEEIEEFFSVNIKGTDNLLKSLNSSLPRVFVFISTVAVYGIDEGENIAENHTLLGESPYAVSKIEAEKLVLDWSKKNKIPTVILRLPLISGPNPPGNLASMAKAIKRGYYFRIGQGLARKSMVGAVDVAKVIPSLFGKSGIFNLTDGLNPDIKTIENHIAQQFGKKIKSIPIWPLKMASKLGDYVPTFPINTMRLNKLTASLTFSDALARKELGWKPESALNALKFEDA